MASAEKAGPLMDTDESDSEIETGNEFKMSFRGIKRPLSDGDEQNSPEDLNLLQPVGDSSLECVLSAQPVTDPYSSADSSQQEEIPNRPSRKSVAFSYNGSTVTISQIKRYFNLAFYSMPTGPTPEELVSLDIPVILDHMMQFVMNTTDVTGHMILENLEINWKSRESERPIDVMEKDQVYHIDFKKWSSPWPQVDINAPPADKSVVDFMEKLKRSLLASESALPAETKVHHALLKQTMTQLCILTTEVVTKDSLATQILEANVISKIDDLPHTVKFTAHPDLILDPGSNTSPVGPGIPFEVYSPLKKQVYNPKKRRNWKKTQTKRSAMDLTTEDDSVITDGDSRKPLGKFLSDNIPNYLNEESTPCRNKFMSKLVSQHVLQIIGKASAYCAKVLFEQLRNSVPRVFIGFFVLNEYVYITKVQGEEFTFAKYQPGFKQSITPKLNYPVFNQHKHVDPILHVQFSPMVLDITVHNHRIALLRFMQYYMYNGYNLKIKLIDSK